MIEFTREEKQKYLRINFGSNCPKCASEDIEGIGMMEMEGGQVYQEIECNECGLKWYDVYTLTDITPSEGDDE